MPRTGTGDAHFGQYLDDNGVYPDDGFVTKPQNWDELLGMVEQSKPLECAIWSIAPGSNGS